MAGRNQETRLALTGGSSTESSITKRTGPVCDEEMIDLDDLVCEEEEEEEDDEEYDDDEAASEEDEPEEGSESEAGSEDEWGFGEKKPRFSKEVLVGAAAVAVLCSVFGIVVWQNLGKGAGSEEAATSPEGELGDEGKSDSTDPFTGKGEVRTAAHIEVGEGKEKPAEEGPFTAGGTGGEMGTFVEGEPGGGIGELQGEPAIEEGINVAESAPRLDPFGQPLNSGTTGIGESGIGESKPASTGIGESGIGETTLGSATIGETSPGGETAIGSEQPTGLFAPLETRSEDGRPAEGTLTGSAIGETVRSESGDEINPFATRPDPFGGETAKPRVDEFGRPIDEFGRPLEAASTDRTGIGETTQPLLDSPGTELGSTGIGSPGIGEGTISRGDGSIGITESTTGIGEATTGIGESTTGIGEGTTELFPSETTSTTRISEKPTGLFGPQTATDGSLDSTTPGIGESTPTTGTPGFGANTEIGSSETETFFPPETSSTGDTGTLPSESTFPTSSGIGSLPETGSPEIGSPGIGIDTGTGTSQPGFATEGTGSLPVIESADTSPFGSSGSAAIIGGYPVQPGDSYWTISKKLYGTARYFRVLSEYNSKAIPDPSKMRPGMTIRTPDEAILRRMLLANSSISAGSPEARRPAGASPITPASGIFFDEKNQPRYRVGKDDTLTTIAAEHLGRWARWRQIFEMNKDQMDNPNKLQIGMILKLPADAARTSMSERDNQIR